MEFSNAAISTELILMAGPGYPFGQGSSNTETLSLNGLRGMGISWSESSSKP